MYRHQHISIRTLANRTHETRLVIPTQNVWRWCKNRETERRIKRKMEKEKSTINHMRKLKKETEAQAARGSATDENTSSNVRKRASALDTQSLILIEFKATKFSAYFIIIRIQVAKNRIFHHLMCVSEWEWDEERNAGAHTGGEREITSSFVTWFGYLLLKFLVAIHFLSEWVNIHLLHLRGEGATLVCVTSKYFVFKKRHRFSAASAAPVSFPVDIFIKTISLSLSLSRSFYRPPERGRRSHLLTFQQSDLLFK